MTSAVVVGSGPNGLAGAIRLAQAGVRVTVLEAHERPGGGTRTSERTLPGLLHDDCAAFHPTGVASPYFRSLGLERHGLRWLWPEIDLAHPLDDGRAGYASRDLVGSSTASLGADAARWQRIFGPMVRHFDALMEEVLQPVVHVPRHPLALGRFGMKALLPATWSAARFGDDPARALFMGVAAHAFGRLDTPLSGSVGLMLTSTAHAVGWPVAEGGTEAITRALLAVLASSGGRVESGVRVTSLDQLRDVDGGAPDVVLLDTAPAGAMSILGSALPPYVRRALDRYSYGPSAFKVDIAIEGDLPWTNEACRRAGTLHLGGTAPEIAAIEKASVRGEMPERPFVLLGQQYLADPSRSRGDVHPVYSYAHVPAGYDGDATEAITAQIERFAPGFRERIVDVHVTRPGDFAAGNANYVGGDILTGAKSPAALLLGPRPGRNPYRTGARGVYLCSAAAPPGPGAHGMAGYRAAQLALKDLGLR